MGEIVNYRKDGTPFLNWLRIHPVRGARGAVTHFIGVQVDVSAARQELARSEERYRLIIEHAPYGIFALDVEGRFTEMNRAGQAILGRTTHELIGRGFREVIAPGDLAVAEAAFVRVLTEPGDETELALDIVRPDGTVRSLEIIMARFEGPGSRLLYGIARDVTEYKARDLHLRRMERLASMGTLIAGVAHELNNPLTAVRGFAQLLLMDPRSDEDREALEMIQRKADRVAKIVTDLGRVARETQEKTAIELVDVNEVVRHVLRVRAYHLRTHNVATEVRLSPNLPPVVGSRPDLEQVFLNLVTNAEQAFSDAAQTRVLSLRSYESATRVCVDITDNGQGIPPELLTQIFDPFFTTKKPGEGTGLGLSLVQRLLEGHGAEIKVQSTIGSGTTFSVRLPLVQGDSATTLAAPGCEREGSPAWTGRALHVLVIDDEDAIRRSISRYLERRGHAVAQAADGGEALRLIKRQNFDVVLSDLRMPGLSGLEMLRHLRRSAPHVARKVIFFTGDTGEAAENIQETYGDRVLLKPLDFRLSPPRSKQAPQPPSRRYWLRSVE